MPNPSMGGEAPEEKPEGIAEQAPSTPGALPTTPTLPPSRSKRKRLELVELDGYFRLRGDWFKKLHLGFNDSLPGGAPFPRPLACAPDASVGNCEDTLKSANVRLRLAPVINIDERTSVHIEADALDNLVLGSTPAGFSYDGNPRTGDAPLGGLSENQTWPLAGSNNNTDSLVVKRAWGEVKTALGEVKFGRMPEHWGMGMYANSGGYDPIHGTMDIDADYGDTVDRLQYSNEIPDTRFRAGIAMDWGGTGPTSAQTGALPAGQGGQPWDLEDNDDVNQWTFMFSRMDSPSVFKDKIDQGEFAINYGFYFARRTQTLEQTRAVLGQPTDPTLLVARKMKAYIPNGWLRLGWSNLELEVEAMITRGSVEAASDQGISEEIKLRQMGFVARGTTKWLRDDLHFNVEVGHASGDQWDNTPQGATHIRFRRGLPGPGDDTIGAFVFDPDYKVDLILFREILGAVTNATYFKPSLDYNITDKLQIKGQSIVSFASQRISTPGNGMMYGLEFDFDFAYHADGFSAGMAYGVLFPLGALNHPGDFSDNGGPGFGYGDNAGDAKAAQTIQTRFTLEF